MVKLGGGNERMKEKTEKPPYTNRGAGNTSQSGQIALVDWLQVTLKSVQSLHEVKELFGLSELEMVEFENGYFGYPNMVQSNNISIMWRDDRQEYHVMMTGQGCRFFESVSTVDWQTLIGYLLYGQRANFTRIDLAIDDFSGIFTINTIRRKIRNKETVSKFKTADDLTRYRLTDAEEIVNSLRFGSEQSRLMVRMYDKKLERENEGFEVTVDKWVRTELQIRDDYANIVADQLHQLDFNVGKVVTGHLKNYLRFVNKTKDKNRSRWPTSPFWVKFLDKAADLKLSLQAPDRTIETVEKAIDKQYGPSLAMLEIAKGEEAVAEFLVDIMIKSKDRLKKKHDVMINDYKSRMDKLKDDAINAYYDRVNAIDENRLYDKENHKRKIMEIYKLRNEKNPSSGRTDL